MLCLSNPTDLDKGGRALTAQDFTVLAAMDANADVQNVLAGLEAGRFLSRVQSLNSGVCLAMPAIMAAVRSLDMSMAAFQVAM